MPSNIEIVPHTGRISKSGQEVERRDDQIDAIPIGVVFSAEISQEAPVMQAAGGFEQLHGERAVTWDDQRPGKNAVPVKAAVPPKRNTRPAKVKAEV